MLHRLFTGSAQRHAQLIQALDKRIGQLQAALTVGEGLSKRVHRLEIERNELQERVDSLEGALHKLRGVVHGRRGGRGNVADGGVDAIPLGDKDALRAAVGLRAGVRYTHPT